MITWNGNGLTQNWSEPANWLGGSVPGSADDAVFDGASSSKLCSIDVPLNVRAILTRPNYGGILQSAPGLAHIVSGDFDYSTRVAFGRGCVWNVAGGLNLTPGVIVPCDYGLSTINLNGAGLSGILLNDNPLIGKLNINGSYRQSNGDFGGLDVHLPGALLCDNELNVARNTAAPTFFSVESGGHIGGAGLLLFCQNAALVKQAGLIDILNTAVIAPTNTQLCPGTYASREIQFFIQRTTSRFAWLKGTYLFTGDLIFGSTRETSGTFTVDNSAGADLVLYQATIDLHDLVWIPGGSITLKRDCTINAGANVLDRLIVDGAQVTIVGPLACKGVQVVSGGFTGGIFPTIAA